MRETLVRIAASRDCKVYVTAKRYANLWNSPNISAARGFAHPPPLHRSRHLGPPDTRPPGLDHTGPGEGGLPVSHTGRDAEICFEHREFNYSGRDLLPLRSVMERRSIDRHDNGLLAVTDDEAGS